MEVAHAPKLFSVLKTWELGGGFASLTPRAVYVLGFRALLHNQASKTAAQTVMALELNKFNGNYISLVICGIRRVKHQKARIFKCEDADYTHD